MNKQLSLKDLEGVGNLTASAAEAAGEEVEFDWNDTECVVLPEQPETAVYWNARGEIVIRQRRWPDDDPVIYITRANIDSFLERLTELCGVPAVGKP